EITDTLDDDLDLTSFRFLDVRFGPHLVHLDTQGGHTQASGYTSGSSAPRYEVFTGILIDTDRGELWVDITAELDFVTREAVWVIEGLDPLTFLEPEDPDAGFLPPNDATHRGEGYVTFSIEANGTEAELPEGTEIENDAGIRFDNLEVLTTDKVTNLISYFRPGVPAAPLPRSSDTELVSLGTDLTWAPSRFAETYDVYLWADGEPEPAAPTVSGLSEERYVPTVLNDRELYHWSVEAVNENGRTRGPRWSFRPAMFYVRGDADASGIVNIADPIFILNYLFLGGTIPTCIDAADANGDGGEPSISDPVFLLLWLFAGGNPPPPPTPSDGEYPLTDCGASATTFSCQDFPPCL
ncbi:MAG: hypothetical protein AAF488_04145, partial [Planctomycetota bacterium]